MTDQKLADDVSEAEARYMLKMVRVYQCFQDGLFHLEPIVKELGLIKGESHLASLDIARMLLLTQRLKSGGNAEET